MYPVRSSGTTRSREFDAHILGTIWAQETVKDPNEKNSSHGSATGSRQEA
jgi:hypothetical protein